VNFAESESYLLSLGNEVSTMKLGLENIRKLLSALGDPQNNYLKVQVAGTNGKGSVCVFLDSICRSAGIKTGLYTSPHLVSMTERVRIDGADISEDGFARLATNVRETSEKLVAAGELENIPTYFEQVTAIALLAFAEAGTELAILETGLGGRLDATTAANAEIAAITRIDLDHQKYLGDTIEEIAAEKAAIIHQGSRVVIGEQEDRALKVILERCREFGILPAFASAVATGRNPTGRGGELHFGFWILDFGLTETGYTPLGLAGRHQIENAKVAVGVAKLLREHLSISDEHIRTGLVSARHPGRLESIGEFLFDGAHNVGGAKALRAYLDEFVDRPITMIFGLMDDKDACEIASILFPKANNLILTKPGNSRALSASQIYELVPDGTDRANVFITDNVLEAIEKAKGVSAEGDVILVTGSLYLVGAVRRIVSKIPSRITEN
jgi:dihydrofolate synthase / folylpolyglutamate synthase